MKISWNLWKFFVYLLGKFCSTFSAAKLKFLSLAVRILTPFSPNIEALVPLPNFYWFNVIDLTQRETVRSITKKSTLVIRILRAWLWTWWLLREGWPKSLLTFFQNLSLLNFSEYGVYSQYDGRIDAFWGILSIKIWSGSLKNFKSH